MKVQDYKDALVRLNQFHVEMVGLRIKTNTASFEDYSELITKKFMKSFERAVWRGVSSYIQSFQVFLFKNR